MLGNKSDIVKEFILWLTSMLLYCLIGFLIDLREERWDEDVGTFSTWRMKSLERDCEVFQLRVTKVAATATGNT